MDTNGDPSQGLGTRAEEVEDLLTAVTTLITTHIRETDTSNPAGASDGSIQSKDPSASTLYQGPKPLLNPHPPKELETHLNLHLPSHPEGRPALLSLTQRLLDLSVNTWHPGFLDKLYASPHPVTLAADLVLGALNTNVHVYSVAPALTAVEREVCLQLAKLFGLSGPCVGGVGQPGGSAANLSSLVIARNVMFPEVKAKGLQGRRLVLFTSEDGHYSVEKAAQILGLGSEAVVSVPVDGEGRMSPPALASAIVAARERGEEPFYVNATAGTTVMGSFDPLDAIADVCEKEGLWLHVDASWGGGVVFSQRHRGKLAGIGRADTVAFCAHKMLNVALTCSFLLGRDVRKFQKAMGLRAGYLFHSDGDEDDAEGGDSEEREFWDLGDLTPQCGRRGDSLKLALSWVYYGTSGFEAYIDHAFEMAAYLSTLVAERAKFALISTNPPPCLQVCFYFNPQQGEGREARNSRITERTKKELVGRGFMIDYAPGEEGKFFRVVVNGRTERQTVERLVKEIEGVGSRVEV